MLRLLATVQYDRRDLLLHSMDHRGVLVAAPVLPRAQSDCYRRVELCQRL